ncbi:MAG: hypothetical protein JXQ82_10335 [Methanomicrobiaceae archaeon]|nr:hypothetical protein [Methanomicrobiaceae archaeon]
MKGDVPSRRDEIIGAVIYMIIAIATCIGIGAVLVVVHEHIHSTTAYLLGHMANPLDIVWGNPVTLDGWDEGVSYSTLFSSGQGFDAAVIAVMPLIFHALIAIAGLYLLLSNHLLRIKWIYHLVFWLVVVDLMELFAYMPGRAFSLHGDIGNINHGLSLSPWILFVIFTPIILYGIYLLYVCALPRMNVLIGGKSRLIRYVILILSAFYLFLFRSSIENALAFSPEMQWATSLCGYAGFVIVLYYCRPAMPWVIKAENRITAELCK